MGVWIFIRLFLFRHLFMTVKTYILKHMKKNQKGQKAGARKEQGQKKRKGKASDQSCQGFTTLNQVAGVPKPRSFHSSIPVARPKEIREPRPVCPVCGKIVENVAFSFLNANEEFVHFDCALDLARRELSPGENQVVSYVGCGNFALCEKDGDGKFRIIRSISFEDQKRFSKIKEYVESVKV